MTSSSSTLKVVVNRDQSRFLSLYLVQHTRLEFSGPPLLPCFVVMYGERGGRGGGGGGLFPWRQPDPTGVFRASSGIGVLWGEEPPLEHEDCRPVALKSVRFNTKMKTTHPDYEGK